MDQAFHVEVRYPDGRVEHLTAQVGGGSHSPETLAKWYQDINHFPGASEIIVRGSDGPPAATLIQALKDAGVDPSKNPVLRSPQPLLTPAPRIADQVKTNPAPPPSLPISGVAGSPPPSVAAGAGAGGPAARP